MCLLDGDLKALDGDGVLGTDVNVTLVRTDAVARDGHGFQHAVGIALQHASIHESAGVALVGVAADILFALGTHGKLPLEAGGEACAAAASEAGGQNLFLNLLGSHFGEHLGQGLVAVKGDILVDVLGIDYAAVAQNHALLLLIEVDLVQRLDFFGGIFVLVQKTGDHAALDQVLGHDLVDVLKLYVAVERAFGINDDHGASRAQTEAARADELDFLLEAVCLKQLLKAGVKLHGPGRGTAGTAADQNSGTEKLHIVYLLSYSALPMVYSATGWPLTTCSATMRGTMSGFTLT